MNRKKYESWLGGGYEGLVCAIIKQAVTDYTCGTRALMKNPHDFKAQKRAGDARRFFLSRWYAAMTDIDGKWILNKIDQEIADEAKRKKVKN